MERYEIGSNTIIDDKASIESQYQKMEIDREIYLERARDSAELTIPYLVPEKVQTQQQIIQHHINQLVLEV